MSTIFQTVFSCCIREKPPNKEPHERTPLLPGDVVEPPQIQDEYRDPDAIGPEGEAILAVVHETSGKMVNVTSNHPFLLRPITSGIKPSTSMSGSRTPSPGHSLATGEDPSPETVPGEGFDGPPRKPFKASLVRLPLRRGRSGRGRGREPRVEVNPPREIVVETGEEETEAPPPSIKPLSEADRETIISLSSEISKALSEGFKMRDTGRVVEGWDSS